MADNQTTASPNLSQIWATPPSTPTAPVRAAGTSLADIWATPTPSQAAPAPTPNTAPEPAQEETPSGGLSSIWGTPGPQQPSPENGQPKPAEDPNAPWYKKAWDFANTPLTESLLGWGGHREGATGVEKGAEEVVSGFTSPLSIALTLATFGTAGFLESAGANVLRQAGLSLADIATVGKGAEIAADAVKAGKIGEGALNTALKAADIDPAFYHGAMDKLYAARLTEADLTSGNAVERGVSQIARKVGLTPFQAQNVAKGVQTLASVGFTGQAAQSALEMSPRVLDALKDGDYEHAAEYATEAAASGLFAVAGASHSLRAAGELVDPALGAKLRPTDEAMDFKRQFDIRDGDVQAAQEKARLLEEESIKALGHKNPLAPTTTESTNERQNAQLAKIYHGMTLGFDKDLAAQHFNAIAEAAGRDERLPTGEDRLISRDQVVDAIRLANSRGKFTGNMEGVEALAKSIPQGEYVQARIPLSAVDAQATHPEITQQYASNEGPLPPSYGTFKDGKVFLEDGNHRAEAAKQRGETSIGVMMPKADYDAFRQQIRPENGQAISPKPEPEPEVSKPGAERRKDVARRQRVSEMSPEEMRRELLTSQAVNLPNRRAFNEAETATPAKAVAMSDADGLKALNDKFGYEAGNELLKAKAEALKEAGLDAYHDKGDEFMYRGDSAQDIEAKLNAARSILRNRVIEVTTADGRVLHFKGADFSFGTGDNLESAESGLKQHKAQREAAGERARGELRGITQVGPSSGQVNQGPAPQVAGQHPALPYNLRELIQNSDLKSKPASYIDNLLQAYKGVHEGLSDVEQNIAKSLRDKLDKSWEDANTHNIMSDRIENYMRRVWKAPSPEVNRAIHDANNGRFETSVSMAKHRVFTDELTPILKGYELATEDPVRLTSQYLADTYKAIANRKFIDRIRAEGIRASDGRPATALSGIGQTIGEGENQASLVTHTRVQNIRIADNEIERLRNSGDLQRHLESGVIEDVTPKAHTWNLKDVIDRLEQKMTSSNVKFDEEGNSVALRDIQLLKDVRDGKRPASDLDEFNASQKPVYVWRPQDYIKIDNAALRKAKFLIGDTAGNPIIAQSDMLVHPEYAKYLQTRLGLDKSGLQEWAPTRALLKGGVIAKKTLLSLSPFHMNQEALRAVMMGVNPLMKTAPSIEESPALRKMVENGLTLEPDYKGLQAHSEGLSGGSTLIGKIPGVGKTLAKSLDWYEHFLFQRYIPNLKARAALLMNDRYAAAHPDWTPDKVAEIAARHVNDNFGGQNWRAMGISAATQDWARLLTLAPDWLTSELNSTARLFNRDTGGIGRAQVAKMAMAMWGVARVLNMVSTGHPHLEAPFGLAVKNDQGKETVYSMRTLPTDILHMVSDPAGFLKGRLSPEVRAAQEILSGRDQFGRKLSNPDLAVDLFRNISPLPLQALGQIANGTGPEVGNTGQVVKALGGTATTYRTEAQKLAAQLASNHSEDGPVDQSQLHRHRVIMDFEDQLRQGKMTPQQLYGLVIQGQLPQADAKKAIENLRQTQKLTPDMASLYTRASRLPAKELLDVYDTATPSEKQALSPLVLKTRRAYVKSSLTKMTPQERMADPVLRRLLNIQTEQPPF